MCYNGKYARVEHGSLALGVISAVGTALALLWSIVYGIITLSSPREHTPYPGPDNGLKSFFADFVSGMILLGEQILVTTVAVGSVVAFIFSVLLCVGVCKRRPGLVLAYFIYGVIVISVSTLASVSVICDTWNDYPLPGILGLLACAVYSLCLVMVNKTYVKLRQEAMFENHIPLVEEPQKPVSPQINVKLFT